VGGGRDMGLRYNCTASVGSVAVSLSFGMFWGLEAGDCSHMVFWIVTL
jgi:hypothetical protein